MGNLGVESRGGICEKRGCWVIGGFASSAPWEGIRLILGPRFKPVRVPKWPLAREVSIFAPRM